MSSEILVETVKDEVLLLYAVPIPHITIQFSPALPASSLVFSTYAGSSGSTGIMLSTLWNQSGIAKVGDNRSIAYNAYCPYETGKQAHSLTGCTNTAAGQIIYYYIEKYDLDLQLTLNSDDAYTDENGLYIAADGSTPGTVSFSVINEKLADYDLSSADDAAALVYACGVIQKAAYGTDATSTAWQTDLFYRAGFESVNEARLYWDTKPYWGVEGNISDAGFEVLIENLTAGRVVGTSYPGHALVIDGYDSTTDTFHINFGWGNSSSTRWYTREEMNDKGFREFFYDLMLEGEKEFFVTDSRIYGTGTAIRAFELANGTQGANTVIFTDPVADEVLHFEERFNILNDITVNNFNMSFLSGSDIGFYCYSNSSIEFNDFCGDLIVNHSSNAWGMYFSNSASLDLETDGAIIYAGACSQGSETLLAALKASQKNGTTLSDSYLSSISIAINATNNNDTLILDNKTIVAGKIYLNNGNDTLSVLGGSHVYGDISCGDGSDTITIDNSSSVTGCFFNTGNLHFILDSTPDSDAMFYITTNVNNLYSNATITVDISDAVIGNYTLITAADNPANVRNLDFLKITLKDADNATYTLSVNGTSTCDLAKLVRNGDSLVLNYTGDQTPPAKPQAKADITTPTNEDVTITVTYSEDSVTRQYKIGNGAWQDYTAPFKVSENALISFRASDAAGNEIQNTLNITNIDKTPPEKPQARADITYFTCRDVTITAQYSSDSVTRQYKIGNGEWKNYTAPFKVSANEEIIFRGVDAAGNESQSSLNITNIDKSSDIKPFIRPDITTLTNQSVTVTVIFRDDLTRCEYKIGNGEWRSYTAPFEMAENGFIYVRANNVQGKQVNAEFEVDYIDKTPPEKPIVRADITAPTREDVTVTASLNGNDGKLRYKIGENGVWREYTAPFTVRENAMVYVCSEDDAGNWSEPAELDIRNIDKTPPTKPVITPNITAPTREDVLLTADFSDDAVVRQFKIGSGKWQEYTEPVKLGANAIVYFKAADALGNEVVNSINITNIDKTPPTAPAISADILVPTTDTVTVTAAFSRDSVVRQYKIDDGEWQNYTRALVLSTNATLTFRAEDTLGNESSSEFVVDNIDLYAPGTPDSFTLHYTKKTITVDWQDSADIGKAGVKGYCFRYGQQEFALDTESGLLTQSEITLTGLAPGVYYYQVCAVDALGNTSAWSSAGTFEILSREIKNLEITPDAISWSPVPDAAYIAEYTFDNFFHTLRFSVTGNAVDVYGLPTGSYQCRVQAEGEEFSGSGRFSTERKSVPQHLVSDGDGNIDIFFVQSSGIWYANYVACHHGNAGIWEGTGETVSLKGKTRFSDIFEGSATDANILVLTDNAKGDALFLDDIFTTPPAGTEKNDARITQIREIRCGYGDDVVDMTSTTLAYESSMTVYGGYGNDVLWGGSGENHLFGDQGDDRIIGGNADDIIIGGTGSDVMHGGGGEDIYVFCKNFGKDTVEQLENGRVILWFESGSQAQWDEETLTYSHNGHSVTVKGVAAENIELKFGTDTTDLPADAFASFASSMVFEQKKF